MHFRGRGHQGRGRLLVVNHIGSLPVLDDADKLIGIITETDIFKIMAGMIGALPEDRGQAEDASLVC